METDWGKWWFSLRPFELSFSCSSPLENILNQWLRKNTFEPVGMRNNVGARKKISDIKALLIDSRNPDSAFNHGIVNVGGFEPEIKLGIGDATLRRTITKKLVIHREFVSVQRLQISGQVSYQERTKIIHAWNIRFNVRLGEAGNLRVAKCAG